MTQMTLIAAAVLQIWVAGGEGVAPPNATMPDLVLTNVSDSSPFPVFHAALADCARFVVHGGQDAFESGPELIFEDGALKAAAYPEWSANYEMLVGVVEQDATSTAAGMRQCSGHGALSPHWPEWADGDGMAETQSILSAQGFVELQFPAEQKLFANCDGAADVFVLFNSDEEDKVVFAVSTGSAAQVYCQSFLRLK